VRASTACERALRPALRRAAHLAPLAPLARAAPQVWMKVMEKQKTNYNEVADELVQEFREEAAQVRPFVVFGAHGCARRSRPRRRRRVRARVRARARARARAQSLSANDRTRF